MSFGGKIWDASGNVIVDTTDSITRLRYSVELTAGASGSVVLSDIDGKSTAQFAIALTTDGLPPVVSRSGTTISWTARSSGFGFSPSAALLLIFLYD